MLRNLAVFVFVLFASLTVVHAADLPPLPNDVAQDQAISTLAKQTLSDFHERDPRKAAAGRAHLQLASGDYAGAEETLISLQHQSRQALDTSGEAYAIFYRVYARTCEEAQRRHETFEQAMPDAFRSVFRSLDDLGAALAINAFGSPKDPYGPSVEEAQGEFKDAYGRLQGKHDLAPNDALDVVEKFLAARALQRMQIASAALIHEDDQRRYDMADVLIDTPDGANVNAIVVRPRHSTEKRPTLLGFTVYANPLWGMAEARLTAAHDYAAVVAYTRGMGRSTAQQVPYEHDGADADAVIEWISRQPWSDGRVGMYGGSYNGFTQWAAAKHLPAALRALMPSVTAAPGIDVPMEGNVFLNFVYPWVPYVMRSKGLDQTYYDDQAHWQRLNRAWYVSGRAYRDMDKIDGTPNPIFDRWLDHPSYDAYWQAMIPYKEEFASINIPVLTTTGYYDGGQIGALYYFTQHHRYNPKAEHYLVIGPYNHIGAQRAAWPVLNGYTIDPVAHINIGKVLRYQWFDYVLRHGPKPSVLADTVNYEVMGANAWKHAPSLDAMHSGTMRLYLGTRQGSSDYALTEQGKANAVAGTLSVDMADRSDVDATSPDGIIDKTIDRRNALVFVSQPLDQATEFSGLFSGKLDFVINKKDADISIALYEQMADGRYFQLSWYLARLSYIKDRTHRSLLVPGRQSVDFQNGRLTSRLMQPGSRLVAVIGVVKGSHQQINYGSGKDVSDEVVADAGAPLEIRWMESSYLDIPVSR
nr:CocE/NonD family hydrolase [Dyella sp. ASV24]